MTATTEGDAIREEPAVREAESVPDAESAVREAESAARRSGVSVRLLDELGEFERVFRLFDRIWRSDPANAPISVELMRALSHSGNYVAAAFDGDEMVGASVGFLAGPPHGGLHSHVTGAVAGRGVGFALKLHQRAWALTRGLGHISWTFDPLVRRNAHFNLTKLGARPEEYLPSFYGSMADAINAGDESDRLLVVWRLTAPHTLAAAVAPKSSVAAVRSEHGRPVATAVRGGTALVATPQDIETLRRTDPEAARAWRYAVRESLGGLMRRGGRVTGLTSAGEYLVECR
ncbi:GNAT family N-acetyltransferase [Sphaerisporangium aureirubrum]|uniref:GNAT family N-acetyltransferase n=1 Tax=Sphaerisporangium aureirubrum TaxID=1544736 RepID=A0ABW1NFJ4_9ACTN